MLEKKNNAVKSVTYKDGELYFAENKISDLGDNFDTPLYIMNEDIIVERCRLVKDCAVKYFGKNSRVYYASKAASFKHIYKIINDEGLFADVVSKGEIYTALNASFPPEKLCFHSNNKTDGDIKYAIENRVGLFVCDNEDELLSVQKIAEKLGAIQKILIRLTPGIDPHTFKEVDTAGENSKFGVSVKSGAAKHLTELALHLKNIELCGFHCHIGSQIFDNGAYIKACGICLDFIHDIYISTGFESRELDLGGGFGVAYTEIQNDLDIEKLFAELSDFIAEKTKNLGIKMPRISFEPGRYIVSGAGITVYTVGSVKKTSGGKIYVSVDGSMADNPRFCLYKARYTLLPCKSGSSNGMLCDVVGRCCESGDIIAENTYLPDDIKRGDRIICLCTGAYNYSMSSNYNRLPRPCVIMIKNNTPYIAVRRETLEDIIRNDEE